MFLVEKTFVEGTLKGITITERSAISFEVGKVYGGGLTGPRYRVEGCESESKFKVFLKGRWRYFSEIEAAKAFCEEVFAKTKIVLGVEAV